MRRVLQLVTPQIVLGCFLLAAPPVMAQVASEDQSEALRAAYTLVQQKRSKQAVAQLKPLVAEHAGDVEFNTVYGLALIESGRPTEALIPLRRALALRPDYAPARVQLGRALAMTSELAAARREMALVGERKDLPADVRYAMQQNVTAIDQERKRRATIATQQEQQAAFPPIGPQPEAAEVAVIRDATELIRERRSKEALASLVPLAPRLSGNPEFDYLYGVAVLDNGRPGEAALILRRAVEARPSAHATRAELARALVSMGDLKGARREFQLVRDATELPSTIRDAMGRQITAVDGLLAAQSRPRMTGYVEGAVGYDSNVNGGLSSSTLLIPALAFLGPATIAAGGREKDSAFAELSAGLAVTAPINEDLAVFANLTGTGRGLAQHSEFQTAVGGAELGVTRRLGGFGTVSLAAVGQSFGIDEDLYRHLFGAAGVWRNRLADVWDVSLALSWLRLDYPDFKNLDADRYTATAAIARRFDVPLAPVLSLTVNGGREVTRNELFDFFSFGFVGGRVNLDVTLLPNVVAFAQAGYEARDYDAEFPLFLRHRADDIVEFVGGLEFKVTNNLILRPTARWSRTYSNVDLYDLDRTTASVALRWQF